MQRHINLAYSFTFMLLILLLACKKSDNPEMSSSQSDFDRMVIGIYFGECGGDCASYYLLEDGEVFLDEVDSAFERNLKFSNDPLDVENELITEYSNLVTLIPALLLDSQDQSFGCPDCGDWGAIHFSVDDRSWTLDNSVDNNPEEIRAFVREIQRLLEEFRL